MKQKKSGLYIFLDVMAFFLMISSILLGGYIIDTFGTIEAELFNGITTTETNYTAVFGGFFLIIQGLSAGAFMLAFSFLAHKLSHKIE